MPILEPGALYIVYYANGYRWYFKKLANI
ncbi:hypothetical protein CARN8_700003 [mine drainage metagenome]|uniref:Uncharacterized protein n=1 Tax=mine drainage metagenome TaxID=410659 RepID=A0A3P3ZS53_9ZZZZ